MLQISLCSLRRRTALLNLLLKRSLVSQTFRQRLSRGSQLFLCCLLGIFTIEFINDLTGNVESFLAVQGGAAFALIYDEL